MSSLIDKWGSKESWLQALYLRANVMWLFREELIGLELHESQWLQPILEDAYLTTTYQARRLESDEDALQGSVELIKNNIEHKISRFGEEPELKRLLQIVNDAQPYDVIDAIFVDLAERARAVYRKAPRRVVRLSREWLNSHPRVSPRPGEFADPYHINAYTRVQAALSVIELQVYLDEFDLSSLYAIPALLTHELVCHAYADEDRNSSQSIWAEGVMDWVAVYFFELWSVRLQLPYTRVKNRGEDLWGQRMTGPRYAGREIADILVHWLVNEGPANGLVMARQITTKFALEINATSATLLEKDALASRISVIEADLELQDAFRAWRDGSRPVAGMLS
jgi:hypothetical protein